MVWPFTEWVPPLHRELEKEPGEECEVDDRDELIEKMATEKRVQQQDKHGKNALHVACAHQPSMEMVELFVSLYPECVRETDKTDRLPLHIACAHQASFQVVQYLLDLYPESIEAKTSGGVSGFMLLHARSSTNLSDSWLVSFFPTRLLHSW